MGDLVFSMTKSKVNYFEYVKMMTLMEVDGDG
jgi:hypothetical protein